MNTMLFYANHTAGGEPRMVQRLREWVRRTGASSARKPFLARIEDFFNARYDDEFWKEFENRSRHLIIW